jgi:hypothetical protein
MAYIGKGLDNGVRNQFIFAATQGQTSFSGADADGKTLAMTDILYTDCYQNGVKLKPTTDYTVSLTTLTLISAASLNDVINIVSFDIFAVPDTVPASTGGTFSGGITATTGTFTDGLTVDDDGTTPLIVDRASSDGTIIEIHKDGSVKGKIGNSGNDPYIGRNAGVGLTFQNNKIRPANGDDGSGYDNAVDLGEPTYRFKDLYLSSGVFLGGTGSANELDDYEEGTWTAAFTATSGSITINQSAGTYTKIGRQVTVSGAFTVGSVSSNSGDMGITGLPFTSGSGTGFSTSAALWLNTINTQEGKTIQSKMVANSNQLFIFDLAGGNSAGAAAYFKANSVINISLTYFTA